MGLMEKIFGDLNEKEVKKVSKIADQVLSYDEAMQALTDDQLREKTAEFKKRVQDGETLDDILPEAFAVCRAVSYTHLDVYKRQNQNCYMEVYAGRLKTDVELVPELHPLCWLELDEDFFDTEKFAGEGNIGHMVEQVNEYGMGCLLYTSRCV